MVEICDEKPLVTTGSKKTEKRSSLFQSFYPHSSLIRRARLIRRSTTNHYCEQLKRLKDEDSSLIKQILIIRLKQKSDINEFESHLSNGVHSELEPIVDFAYPPLEDNAPKYQPAIFYPDFMRSTLQCKESLESYPVILTDDKGVRTFAYCYKFLPKQNRSQSDCDIQTGNLQNRYAVLVLISHFRNEPLFHQLAEDFVQNSLKDTKRAFSLCQELLTLRMTGSNDILKRLKTAISRPECRYSGHISTLIQQIGVETSVFGLLCLLAEKRIIVSGTNVSDVSRAVQAFVRLMFPLDWPYTLIPTVPDSRTELCYNPTPFICGILRYNLNKIRDLIVPLPGDTEDEIIIIDVERGIILPCLPLQSLTDNDLRSKALLNWAHNMGFPKSLVADLLASLRSVLPIKSPSRADDKIEKRIMIWYAKIFGHYRAYGTGLLSSRSRKRLSLSHPSADVREMLQWFAETGVLQTFFFNHLNDQFSGSAEQLERFHKIIKKFGPPVDKNGKSRKVRSFVWRIFNH